MPVARNAFALVLLTALSLGGCSYLKGNKEAKESEAKLVALRARTDSLRKARHAADSLAQIRYAACADSVRTEMTKPPVAIKGNKKKKKAASAPPSDEMIAAQARFACGSPKSVPQPNLATAPAKPAAADSSAKTPAAAASPAPAATAQAPAAAAPAATQSDSVPTATQDAAWADSVRKAKEMEMSRETFAYSGSARDPFNSLLNMAKSGPELADLQLVGIYQNLRSPSGSVAVFREKDGGKRHKLRTGDQLGRSKLVQIRGRDVVFTIEDFGFERQDTLSLRKQEDVTP
jgi:hypothetical protein